jgi:hypothetical protein
MDGLIVFEGHDAKDPSAELGYPALIANATVWVHFAAKWISQDSTAPLPLDVGALPKHHGFEVPRCLEHVVVVLASPVDVSAPTAAVGGGVVVEYRGWTLRY